MIAFRKAHPALWQPALLHRRDQRARPARHRVARHELDSPGFDDPDGRALACTIAGFDGAPDLHVMMNMFWEPLTFEVPRGAGPPVAPRHRHIGAAPLDIVDLDTAPLAGTVCRVEARSIVVLRD